MGEDATILGEIRGLRQEFRDELGGIRESITTLLQAHHSYVFWQAEKNSTFAERSKLDQLAASVQEGGSSIAQMRFQLQEHESDIKELRQGQREIETSISSASKETSQSFLHLLESATAQRIALSCAILSPVASFLLYLFMGAHK